MKFFSDREDYLTDNPTDLVLIGWVIFFLYQILG